MSLNTLARTAAASTSDTPPPPDPKTSALTKYIPTESITFYVAIAANLPAIQSTWKVVTPFSAYLAVVLLTPLVVLVLFANKLPEGVKFKDVEFKNMPWWPMIAGTIAFGVWAWSVPGNPIMDTSNQAKAVVSGLATALISSILAGAEALGRRFF